MDFLVIDYLRWEDEEGGAGGVIKVALRRRGSDVPARLRGDDDDVHKKVHILERSSEPLGRNQCTQAERKKKKRKCL